MLIEKTKLIIEGDANARPVHYFTFGLAESLRSGCGILIKALDIRSPVRRSNDLETCFNQFLECAQERAQRAGSEIPVLYMTGRVVQSSDHIVNMCMAAVHQEDKFIRGCFEPYTYVPKQLEEQVFAMSACIARWWPVSTACSEDIAAADLLLKHTVDGLILGAAMFVGSRELARC